VSPVRLTEAQTRILRRWSLARTAAAVRARIVLACAEGDANAAVARRLGVSRNTVAAARDRFLREGLAGLADRPRSGRPRRISDQQRALILAALAVDPPSTRVIAAVALVSQSTVSRLRRAVRPNA
jgi:DNA-binding CsgD family transcriptional regulator